MPVPLECGLPLCTMCAAWWDRRFRLSIPAKLGAAKVRSLKSAERREHRRTRQHRRIVGIPRLRIPLLGRDACGAEFVLRRLDRYLPAVAADDLPGRDQLHRRHVVQQYRPRDRKLHIEALGEMPSCVEADSSTGDIDRLPGPRIQHATPPDELPLEVQLQLIPAILPPVSPDRIAIPCRFSPKRLGIHELSLIAAETEFIIRTPSAK